MQKKPRYVSMLCYGLTAVLLAGCQMWNPVPPPSPYAVGTASTFRPGMNPVRPSEGRTVPPENRPATARNAAANVAAGRTVKVALLVPLSGPNAKLGSALVDAATLAVFDKYAGLGPAEITAKLELLPKDSGDTPATAASAANKAIKEGAVLILGPLFSSQIDAVAAPATKAGVNVVSFSNDVSAARRGVYLLGFAADEQVDRVTGYALDRGAAGIAALLPTTPYGSAVAAALNKSASRRGKRIDPVLFYTPGTEGALTGAADRLGAHVREHPVQALFVAEGTNTVSPLLAALHANRYIDLNAIKLLGTGSWDDPNAPPPPELAGAWFASSPPALYRQFESRFTSAYQYRPPRIASLAYDAVALAATLALAPTGPDFSSQALTAPGGFSGPANGLFRFRPDGTSERSLAVLEVSPNGPREIAAAPNSF